MSSRASIMTSLPVRVVLTLSLGLIWSARGVADDEPPALNPFAPRSPTADAGEPPALNPFGAVKQARDDAVPGYVEMSDGRIFVGDIYLTRDKRLKLFDETLQRQREIPLKVIRQIECKVLKEWMEKEWRFKEMANDEKYFTGREYPSREYLHTVTLQDDRTITGPLAELVYLQPYSFAPATALSHQPVAKPLRLMIHKRDKGDVGTDLESLTFVRLIKLGEEALAEGREKATEADKKNTTKPPAR